MGGLVTSYHAGMSVPDWPNSYGYNMFLFPPSQWVGGILYEHTHRLMGTVVGMCAMALAAWAWRGQIRNLIARFLPVSSAAFRRRSRIVIWRWPSWRPSSSRACLAAFASSG